MKKIPKDLSTEELLNSLNESINDNNSIETNNDSLLSEILLFISQFNLNPGEYQIHQKYIYKLYRCYSKFPVSSVVFLTTFNSVYPHKTQKTFYSVNKSIVNILKIIDDTQKNRFLKNKYNPRLINSIKKFLNELDLKSGSIWIESFVLTELYNDYRKKLKLPNYKQKTLTSAIGLFFETAKTKHGGFIWIKINKNVLDIFDEVRYNEYINTRGLEWWKNLPKEVNITEENERKKKAKDAISHQNRKYRGLRKKKQIPEKEKNFQH